VIKKTITPRLVLKEVRASKGTQRKIATALGITETHLRELESGRSIPGTKLLIKMEYYFGIPNKELFPDLYTPDYYLQG
jgi:transcriptional regulator with XRE-family HTH domain